MTEGPEPPPDQPGDIAPEPTSTSVPEPTPEPAPTPVPAPMPAVESTRRLLGASFDLLTRTPEEMRRASFYIGTIILGTVGPFALASWGIDVIALHRTGRVFRELVRGPGYGWYEALVLLALIGVIVAAVESRTMAAAVLGGSIARHPVTVREALARSRMVFWRAIVASIIAGVPVLVGRTVLDAAFRALLGPEVDASVVSSTLGAIVIGAPFAYLLSGVVLGDVNPVEGAIRSFRVFRARKVAAAVVAVFETVAVLLVVFGLSAGLDIAQRVFGALGLGADSGPAGLALVTVGVVVGVFALGTLIYTALAISLAPQVVMFVGLTHATMGLDHVRPGGDHDPDPDRTPFGGRRFRWVTRPMLMGFAFGGLGLAATLAIFSR